MEFNRINDTVINSNCTYQQLMIIVEAWGMLYMKRKCFQERQHSPMGFLNGICNTCHNKKKAELKMEDLITTHFIVLWKYVTMIIINKEKQ